MTIQKLPDSNGPLAGDVPSGQHPYSVVSHFGLGCGTTLQTFIFFFFPGKLLALDLPGLAAVLLSSLPFLEAAASAFTLSFSMTSTPAFFGASFLADGFTVQRFGN